MKKLVRSVLMLSMASIAILSSCSKDDDNDKVTDVTIDITSSPANPVVVGSTVTLTITATGNVDNKLKSISVVRDDGKEVLSKSLSGSTATEVILDTLGTNESYIYTVAVTGEKGSPVTKIHTITTKVIGFVDITPTPVPLFAQSFTTDGAHFMKVTDPHTTFMTDQVAANKANIDIVYYYGGSKHTITSPSDAPMQQQIYTSPGYDWTGAKDTKLSKAKIDAAAFDAFTQGASDESLVIEGKATNTWASAVKDLKAGDVLIYKTAAGKYGYIKVDAVAGANGTDAEIGLKFVSQQN